MTNSTKRTIRTLAPLGRGLGGWEQPALVRILTLTPALSLEGRGGRTAQDITLRLCESINNASHFHCNHNQMQPELQIALPQELT